MKQAELIALGLAAIAVFMITKKANAAGGGASASGDFVTEVLDSAGKAFTNGWRYFSDGTSIDPQGNYYSGGQLVYAGYGTSTNGSW